jgi:hypothetical protein
MDKNRYSKSIDSDIKAMQAMTKGTIASVNVPPIVCVIADTATFLDWF